MKREMQRASAALAMLFASGLIAVQAAPAPSALNSIEKGAWVFRERGQSPENMRICVSDPRRLLQLRHRSAECRHFQSGDTANSIAMTYECGSAGSGRTDLRVETSRLIQLRSQGVAHGAPFDLDMEGRWVGTCGGGLR